MNQNPTQGRLDKWRSSSTLTSAARQFFETSMTGVEMLAILDESVPRGFPYRGEKFTGDQAVLELGRIEGFRDAIEIIKLMAVDPAPMPQPIESTFEKPEE